MAFRITITDDAQEQLRALAVHERRALESAILARLRDRPTTPTKAIKRLRPNPGRVRTSAAVPFEVLYDVEGEEVVLLIVGRKVGNTLVVAGEAFHEHQS